MRKLISIIALLHTLLLVGCANQNTPKETDDHSTIGSITMLDDGVWPENQYTDGLPVPRGNVVWVALDEKKGYCAITVEDITEEEYNKYMDLLKADGYAVIEEVSEEIDGQDYVSIGTIMEKQEKGLSISYIPDTLGIYISIID